MAVRYSGECEIRLDHVRDGLKITVRWPGGRASGTTRVPRRKITPEIYDRMATKALELVMIEHRRLPVEKRMGLVKVRREFVAPCPA